ncbi:MAG: HrpJ domain-containing protein [Chlamydiia bacterium]
MADNRIQGVRQVSDAAQRIRQQQLQNLQKEALANDIRIDISADSFEEWSESAWNPSAANRYSQELSKRLRPPEKEKPQGAKQENESHQVVEEISSIAEEYSRKNPEFNIRALLGLHLLISAEDSVETILEKLFLSYRDAYLVDEALSFMLKTTKESNSLFQKLGLAKELLNQNFAREVKIGRNISAETQEFSKKGLGSATGLRDLYKEVTSSELEPIKMFEDLVKKFPYEHLKSVINFLLHSLGSDIKSKGPSMDPLELQKLFAETRTMQAILGVYLYFLAKMNYVERQFGRNGLPLPEDITFEKLAKIFVTLLSDRYPSVGRVLQLSQQLGISDSLIAQAIIFGNYRDAIRYISPRLFKNEKQRQDLLQALIECVSELDDKIEEEDEEDMEE